MLGVDYGLDDDPLWLSRYIQSSCQNKAACSPTMPLFWQITTSTKFEREEPTCILGQRKYFLSARVHLECRGIKKLLPIPIAKWIQDFR